MWKSLLQSKLFVRFLHIMAVDGCLCIFIISMCVWISCPVYHWMSPTSDILGNKITVIKIILLNPLYTDRLFYCYMYILDEYICYFTGVGSILLLLPFFFFFFFEKSCKQSMFNLIRRHIMWRLIWACTVCLWPFYGFPGKNGLRLTM